MRAIPQRLPDPEPGSERYRQRILKRGEWIKEHLAILMARPHAKRYENKSYLALSFAAKTPYTVLARNTGIPARRLTALRHGKGRQLTVSELFRLATALNVPTEAILHAQVNATVHRAALEASRESVQRETGGLQGGF